MTRRRLPTLCARRAGAALFAAVAIVAASLVALVGPSPQAGAQSAVITVRNVLIGSTEALNLFDFPMRLLCTNEVPPFAFIDTNGDFRIGPLGPGQTATSYGAYILVGDLPLFDADYKNTGPAGFGPKAIGTAATIDGGAFAQAGTYDTAYLDPVNGLVMSSGPGASMLVSGVAYYDYRTYPSSVPPGGVLGTAANVAANFAAVTRAAAGFTAAAKRDRSRAVVAEAARTSPIYLVADFPARIGRPQREYFTYDFTMRGGVVRTFSSTDIPKLMSLSRCELMVLDNRGGVTTFSSTVLNPDGTLGTPLSGVDTGLYRSAITQMGQTITTTQAFYGSLLVSKVVRGNPRSNIATYEITVNCDRGGPNDTFLLKDRQSKLYTSIEAGATCFVGEKRSDGAAVSYADNSGVAGVNNKLFVQDGSVTIPLAPNGCTAIGSPTAAAPGASGTSADACIANIIIVNDYDAPASSPGSAPVTVTAPPSSAPRSAAAITVESPAHATAVALAMAAPPVEAEPAVPVEDEPTFTG